jgi:hypothetical protein
VIEAPNRDGTSTIIPVAKWLGTYVSSDYGGGYIAFAGDGTVKQMSLPT